MTFFSRSEEFSICRRRFICWNKVVGGLLHQGNGVIPCTSSDVYSRASYVLKNTLKHWQLLTSTNDKYY